MRAIIYGYDPETKEWIELFNRGKFWIIMTDTYYKVWKTIRLSKKYKMRTYLAFVDGDEREAMLPISYKSKCRFFYNAMLVTRNCDYEMSSEWRARKTIPRLQLIGKQQRYWTKKLQFFLPSIYNFQIMDYFIQYWDEIEHDHIKTVADFVIEAVSEFQNEQVLYEASWIMEDINIFETVYKELKILGIKKETFKKASNKYFEFLEDVIEAESI